MIAIFEQERETKRTWRFKEISSSENFEIIETIYIPKETLRALDWTEGESLRIRLEKNS